MKLISQAGLCFEEVLEGDCPAWPSGGGTAAPEVPPGKHKQLQKTHRVPEQGLGTGKVLLFYPNPALCMFAVLVFPFAVFAPLQAELGDECPAAK